MTTFLRSLFVAFVLIAAPVSVGPVAGPSPAMASCGCGACCDPIKTCAKTCVCTSNKQTKITTDHITEAFRRHRQWMVDIFFKDDRVGNSSDHHTIPGMLAAMQIMASQLTATMNLQVLMVGSMLDAKHQMETQRLFQMMTAEAHRDYQPSEGLCEFGTATQGIATAERRGTLTQIALANRMNERQLLSGTVSTAASDESDFWSRLKQFRAIFCNPKDNGLGLENLCKGGGTDKTRYNRDVDFTASVDFPLTLDVDFTPDKKAMTKDEENVFALASNLYANDPLPTVLPGELLDQDGDPSEGALKVLDVRALAAKRSVAQNSFAAIVGQRAQGTPDVTPFLYAAMKEMSNGALEAEEIEKYLGTNPSYNAQMEMLTKKIYQHPGFFTELYDKPANVMRKEAAMQAVNLMQKRDIYRSLLRSETLFSVILETSLMDRQEEIQNEISRLDQEGTVEPLE